MPTNGKKSTFCKSVSTICAVLIVSTLATADDMPIGFSVLGTTVPAGTENIPIPSGFTEVLPATNMTLPTLTPEEISRGYLVFTTNYLQPVYSYTRPQRAEIGNQTSMFSALGQYEPTTFSIHALQALTNVAVTASDLAGPNDTIAAVNVDIRTVRCMPRRGAGATYTISPTLLEKRTSVNVAANRTQQYWITVWIPANKKPGIYTGTLTIAMTGFAGYVVHVSLEVLGIELLNSPVVYGMYYMARDLSQPNYPAWPYEYLYKDTINMREHGMNTLFNSYPLTCQPYAQLGRVKYNLTPLNPLRDAVLAAGFPRVVYNLSLGEILTSTIGTYSTRLRTYVETLNAAGWPEIVCSHGDESDASGDCSTVNSWLATNKSVLPNNLTYTTIVFPENSECHEPYLDIRAFSSYADISATNRTKAAGRQMWIYSGIPDYGLNPKGDRFYRGIWAVSMNLEGAMQWSYFEAVADRTQPFNDLIATSGRNNMCCWVFPGPDGPLPSTGWEGVREGVEDQKYIFTLQSLIHDANQYDSPYLNTVAQQARDLLNGVVNDVNNSPRESDSVFVASRESNKAPFNSYTFYDKFRRQMADYIILLNNAMQRLCSNGTVLAGQTIAIDGNMADWTGTMLVGTDADDPVSWYPDSEDLQHFYFANDSTYLYGRFTNVGVADNQKIWFALDTDNDPCTGSRFAFNDSFGQNGCEAVISMLLGCDSNSTPPCADNPGGGVKNAFVDTSNGSGGWKDSTPPGIWHRTDSATGCEFRVPLATLGITTDTIIRWSAACASSDVFGGTRWSDMADPLTQQYLLILSQPGTCKEVAAAGWGLAADFNKDCRVSFKDFVIIAQQWLRCNDPMNAACERPWQTW